MICEQNSLKVSIVFPLVVSLFILAFNSSSNFICYSLGHCGAFWIYSLTTSIDFQWLYSCFSNYILSFLFISIWNVIPLEPEFWFWLICLVFYTFICLVFYTLMSFTHSHVLSFTYSYVLSFVIHVLSFTHSYVLSFAHSYLLYTHVFTHSHVLSFPHPYVSHSFPFVTVRFLSGASLRESTPFPHHIIMSQLFSHLLSS